MSVKLPSPIDKRNMLYAPDPRRPADFLAIGDAFLESSRACEALDFFERVTDEAIRKDRLLKVKKGALERGDAFVLGRLAGKGLVEKDEWIAAARTAREAGRLRYALKALIAAGDEAAVASLKKELGLEQPVVTDAARPEDAKIGVKTADGVTAAIGLAGEASAPAGTPPAAAPPSDGKTV